MRQLHEAGVPPDVVQLVRCPDNDVGRHLVTHDAVDTVVLTGAYDTAQMFLDWKPQLRLIAETSGKNALVITGGADVDLAIRDLVRSAFGHSGQKCSAASLAIIEASVHDDERFLTRLADAVRSVRVGPPTDLATMMGPVIQPPAGKLRRALTELDAGERWLVEPKQLDGDGALWSPGVKLGVRPGSWFHRTECFGPVLGVMRARDLDDALALQNAPEFGLTGGLHSLDPDEIAHWTDRVQVGNAYVNRHTTGAIVQRQPFGGWKHSSVGPGAKTGGPNDILRFLRFTARSLDGSLDASAIAARDLAGLRAEQNLLRSRPLDKVVVRATEATTVDERRVLEQAARLTSTAVEIVDARESDDALARRIGASGAQRLRALAPISDALAPRVTPPASRSTTPRSPPTGASNFRAGSVSKRSRARSTATAASPRANQDADERETMRDSTIVVFVRSAFWCARTCSTTASSSAGLPVFTCKSASASPVTVYASTTSGRPATISAMSAGFVRLRQ